MSNYRCLSGLRQYHIKIEINKEHPSTPDFSVDTTKCHSTQNLQRERRMSLCFSYSFCNGIFFNYRRLTISSTVSCTFSTKCSSDSGSPIHGYKTRDIADFRVSVEVPYRNYLVREFLFSTECVDNAFMKIKMSDQSVLFVSDPRV